MGLNLKGMFQPCKDYALEKAKKNVVSKKAVKNSKILKKGRATARAMGPNLTGMF